MTISQRTASMAASRTTIALAALVFTGCASGSTASSATSAAPSLAATAASATTTACPPGYPVQRVYGERLWDGRAQIVSIVSVSDGLFTATLVGDNAFTTNPLRLHFYDAERSTFASIALNPGDLVQLQLYGRSDDCSYQVSKLTKVP